MRTKIIIAVSIIGAILVILFNSELMPLRRDIANSEITIVAGIDKVGDKYMVTFLKRDNSEQNENSNSSDSSSSESKVIYMISDSYSMALKRLQTATDKFLTASHIKYFLIGEETIDENISHIADAIARDYQTRLNTKFYITKGITAREFLENASTLGYKIEEKIANMEENYYGYGTGVNTSLIDLGHIIFSENICGLVDSLEYYKNNQEGEYDKLKVGNEQKNEVNSFSFGGAAIISNGFLIQYLDTDQTAYANYITKRNNINILKIDIEEYFVLFMVEKLNTEIDFKFDENNTIKEMVVDVTFEADYEESNAEIPIYTQEKINYFENKLNEKVTEQIQEIINIELEKNVDFLNLSEILEFKHPFKYENNKENFMELLQKAKIVINGKGTIKTTYDIINSNKRQKGVTK